jgi:hypothetical protein
MIGSGADTERMSAGGPFVGRRQEQVWKGQRLLAETPPADILADYSCLLDFQASGKHRAGRDHNARRWRADHREAIRAASHGSGKSSPTTGEKERLISANPHRLGALSSELLVVELIILGKSP